MIARDLRASFLTVASQDVILLLEKATGKNRAFLLAHPEYSLKPVALLKAQRLLTRRSQGEPVAYILGEKEFYGRPFTVSRDTLIPRPETELLIEKTLETLKESSGFHGKPVDVVDIGTGSGNIIITLAADLSGKTFSQAFSYFAGDLSPKALCVAKKNARAHDVHNKISFFQGDLLKPCIQKNVIHSPSLVILANLPYVSSDIFRTASADVRDYEPRSALISGERGLSHYFRLLRMVKNNFSHKSVLLLLEMSPEQKSPLRKRIQQMFPKAKISFFKDLAGRSRVVKISLS